MYKITDQITDQITDETTDDTAAAPDPALQFTADAYHELVRTLRLILPPPPDGDPEALARRDRAAIARVAALVPAGAAEAELAVQFVAASEQWKDCLRLAQDAATPPDWARKCRAQALAMMRQANAALRLLLRLQARREKLEADNVTRDRAAWTEHCAIGLMAEALVTRDGSAIPAARPAGGPRSEEPPAPAAAPAPKPPSSEPVERAAPAPLAGGVIPWKKQPSRAAAAAGTAAYPPIVSRHDPQS